MGAVGDFDGERGFVRGVGLDGEPGGDGGEFVFDDGGGDLRVKSFVSSRRMFGRGMVEEGSAYELLRPCLNRFL